MSALGHEQTVWEPSGASALHTQADIGFSNVRYALLSRLMGSVIVCRLSAISGHSQCCATDSGIDTVSSPASPSTRFSTWYS